MAPTSDGGFVGTGQHNGGGAGGCDSYVYRLSECGELRWYKTYGTQDSDGGRKVIESADGGLLTCGLYSSGGLGGAGYDYFIQKVDANGNELWLTVWNSQGNAADYAHWVDESSTNIYVCGSTQNYPWGGWNAVMSSYSLGGAHQWTKAFGGGAEDNFCSVHAIPNGIIAGGITMSFGAGSRDLFVTKTDVNGNVQWMNAYGTSGVEGGYWDTEGIPTADGGYLMTGSTDLGGLTAGGQDILLIKLDSLGVIEWAKTYGGPANDFAEGVVNSLDGGYAVIATSSSYTNGGRDAALLKVDSLGNFQWANSYGLAGCDRGIDVMVKDSGYVLSMNYNNSLVGCGVNNEYDPMFIKTDSLGQCGCSFINAPYTSMDVTSSIITTAIPASAVQDITGNVTVSSPSFIVNNPNVTETTICTVCSNVTPQWGYNDTIGCHGDTLKFYNTTGSSVGCFYWDNTVNYSSSGDTILFVLDSTQGLTQDVALISVCGNNVDTLKQRVAIVQPQAKFTIPNTCLVDSTIFIDSSTVNMENIIAWNWSFGDGTTSVNQNDAHVYSSEGNYTVELIVSTNHGCADTLVSSITKYPMPQTSAVLTNECLIDSLFFDNTSTITSTDNIVAWAWDFGDGNLEIGEDVYHTYAADGTYEIKLVTVSNNFCADTLVDSVTVYPMPQTNYILSNECLYDSLVLNDLSTINSPDNITSWNWSFGDGQTSNQQNDSHLYTADGTYPIELITASNHGCQDTLRDTVVIYPVPLTNFSLMNQCQIDTFSFNDLSTINGPDSITAWAWNFGDGNGGLNQDENHYYTNDGTYQITLVTTSNNNCYDTLSLPLVVFPMPQASFSVSNQCIADEFTFTSSSTINAPDNIIGWEWEYGDGNGSMQENDSHFYQANGEYQISLVTISNHGCSDTLTDSVTIHPMPNSVFNISNICYTDTINVSDLSIINAPDNIPVRQWDFGDGSIVSTDSSTFHVYQTSGAYDISLITVSNNNCRDTLVQTIDVYPLPNVNFTTSNACVNEQPISFTNVSTISSGANVGYLWEFGDVLNTVSNQENPSFSYPSHGIYDVMLTVTSDLNCTDSLLQTVQVFHKPTAYFLEDTTEGCAPLCVTFNSISNDSLGIATWNWQFENNLGEGNSKYVGYCYEEAGTYDVTLIVQNTEGCYDTIVKPALITTYPFPTAEFELTPTTTTVQEPSITFTNLSVDAVSWVWDFADGTLDSINYDSMHDYQDTGVYNIGLTIYNNIGCPNTVYHQLIVLPIENIFVPSAFSPNGDGENDVLFVRGYAQAMYFTIYDRWGKKVFETNNQNVGWDGLIHQKPATEGVYMWYLQTSYNGENKVYKGDVSLFR